MGVIDWNQGILINLIEIYMQRYVFFHNCLINCSKWLPKWIWFRNVKTFIQNLCHAPHHRPILNDHKVSPFEPWQFVQSKKSSSRRRSSTILLIIVIIIINLFVISEPITFSNRKRFKFINRESRFIFILYSLNNPVNCVNRKQNSDWVSDIWSIMGDWTRKKMEKKFESNALFHCTLYIGHTHIQYHNVFDHLQCVERDAWIEY